MNFFNLFKKIKNMNDVQKYLEKGAIVLDVRTQAEWDEGHVANSEHIVLNLIPLKLVDIKAHNKPIIAVCKSGGRSAQAAQFLNQNGLDVINGAPWQNVDQYMSK